MVWKKRLCNVTRVIHIYRIYYTVYGIPIDHICIVPCGSIYSIYYILFTIFSRDRENKLTIGQASFFSNWDLDFNSSYQTFFTQHNITSNFKCVKCIHESDYELNNVKYH